MMVNEEYSMREIKEFGIENSVIYVAINCIWIYSWLTSLYWKKAVLDALYVEEDYRKKE